MHGVNMLCVFIRIHYFTTGFQLVAKVMHILPIHASCNTERHTVTNTISISSFMSSFL